MYHRMPALNHPARFYRAAHQKLRTLLVIATLLFLICHPNMETVARPPQYAFTDGHFDFGTDAFFGLGLYLWGLNTLGENFNVSSGFGIRLQQAHRLVTKGPFAYVRHPMYLGVMLAAWGGSFLYRTWTMLIFAVMMFGLIVRARREEEVLQVFGSSMNCKGAFLAGSLTLISYFGIRNTRIVKHKSKTVYDKFSMVKVCQFNYWL
jgi:protein-S-isoprenylcysteine O-methyltransferase Ste14